MKYCQKCHQKTELVSGRVKVQIDNTVMETDSPVYTCRKCNMSFGQVQIWVTPNPVAIEEKEKEDKAVVIQ